MRFAARKVNRTAEHIKHAAVNVRAGLLAKFFALRERVTGSAGPKLIQHFSFA